MNPMTGEKPHNPRPAFSNRGVGVLRRAGLASRRDHGSLLILCVTVLIIIALIGIAFLQRVRMDQFATARHERSYINLAINGILDEISGQMGADIDLNQQAGRLLYDYPWTDPNVQRVNAFLLNGNMIAVNGAGVSTGPGTFEPTHEDDRWLASTAPVWNPNAAPGGEYRWLHLTNLTGIWVHLPNPGAAGAGTSVVEEPIQFTPTQIGDARYSDTDLALTNSGFNGLGFRPGSYETRGVDADGDGILDSRWQWAPVSVRRLGGRTFVMALRIVDLNSMLNVNTATSLTLNGSAGVPFVARGHNPAWVDLSRLMSRVSGSLISTSDWPRELSELLNSRLQPLVGAGKLPNPPYSTDGSIILDRTDEVRTMWEEQGSIYGNTDRNYLMNSEMELRRFGGLNDRSLTSVLESQMGRLYSAGNQSSRALRQHPAISADGGVIGPEGSYLDVVDPLNALAANQEAIAISRWFYGDPGVPTEDSDSVPVKNREFPAIRHMLTAASGTGVYTTIIPAVGSTPASARLKFDLNRDWTQGGAAVIALKLDNLRNQLGAVFKQTRVTKGGKYLGLTNADIDDLVAEYVVAIKDYSDPDTVPTHRVTPSGVNAYGLEKLPFLREVYVQALYADVLGDTSDRAPWDPGYDSTVVGTNYVGWQYDPVAVGGDTRAMVIELGNPFEHRIYGIDPDPLDGHVQGLDGRVRIVVRQGANNSTFMFGDPSATTATPDIDARNDSPGGIEDTLLIVSPPVDKIAETGGTHDGSDLLADVGVVNGAQTLELQPGTLTANFTPNGGTITVELEVLADDDNWVVYDRLETAPDTDLPVNVNHPPTPAPANNQFAQASFARDSWNINFVVDDGVAAGDLQTNLPSNGSYSTGTDRLGDDNKGSAAIMPYPFPHDQFFNQLQLPLPDKPMNSVAELAWIHMFGFTDTETFSQRMSANFGLSANEHFLLIDPDDPEYDVVGYYDIPHAALLMDLFTTVSPENDGRDNDNDDGNNDPWTISSSIDNPEELLVPGTINVNTMPMHLMTLASPMGESLDDAEKLMRTIVAYRDEPLRGLPRGAQTHGAYWDVGAAGFDVQTIRDNAMNPNYHLRNFPNVGRLDDPGIASLGELLYLNPGAPANDMLRYGLDGNPALPGGNGGMDTYPDFDDITANGPTLNQGDDNEQRLARFGMLSQAYTVRSDRFVVYGVVRGYMNDQFDRLPVETARFIAVIDRGNMANPGTDSPRVIGFLRLQ